MGLCSNCGAEYAVGLQAACPDCRLASAGNAVPSLPDLDDGPDEMLFDLSLWPAAERVALGLALDERGVPWRWEPGGELVVRESEGAVVEELLGEEEGDDDDWEDVTEDELDDEGDDGAGEVGSGEVGSGEAAAADAGGTGTEEEDDDPEAVAAMGELFDAADRLLHHPGNAEALLDVDRLASVIGQSRPPYGIEPTTWEEMGSRAEAVLAASDDEDEEAVVAASRTLRDFLRTYV